MGGLQYPPIVWGLEIFAIFVFAFFQFMRLDLGKKANRNEHLVGIVVFTIFTILAHVFYIYFLGFTMFVLVIDIITGAMGLFFVFVELVLAICAAIMFRKVKAH